MLPNMTEYVIALLKVILASLPSSKVLLINKIPFFYLSFLGKK